MEQWLNRLYARQQRALLAPEIEAYMRMRPDLLTPHQGQWVAVHKGSLLDSDVQHASLVKRVRQRHPGESIYIVQVDEQFPPEDLMYTPEEDEDLFPTDHN